MCGEVMKEYGFKDKEMFSGIIQIQTHSVNNPKMSHKCQTIMNAFQGIFPDEKDEVNMDEAEECD